MPLALFPERLWLTVGAPPTLVMKFASPRHNPIDIRFKSLALLVQRNTSGESLSRAKNPDILRCGASSRENRANISFYDELCASNTP